MDETSKATNGVKRRKKIKAVTEAGDHSEMSGRPGSQSITRHSRLDRESRVYSGSSRFLIEGDREWMLYHVFVHAAN
jgi:hypothetical protein